MPQLPLGPEDGQPRRLPFRFPSFFEQVALVWAGLQLKERWDEYQRVPADLDALPEYENELDENPTSIRRSLDTSIRRRGGRNRKQTCCVCCGINCSMLFKTIGIVVLISVIWNTFKFVRWMVKPSPTGLEDMPDFDVSLPCSAAPFMYQDGPITKSIPVGVTAPSDGFKFAVQGSAVGTLELSPGAPGAEDVIVKMTLRASDNKVFSHVSFGASDSDNKLTLSTPNDPSGACMRFEATVYIPANLKHLTIDSKSTTQIRVDPSADTFPYLNTISINSQSSDRLAMILPTLALRANSLALQAKSGWIVGSVSIGLNVTTVDTRHGDAVTNLRVYAGPPPALLVMPVRLTTETGSGRTDIVYTTNEQLSPWHQQRPIASNHTSHAKSDMYLTYKDARFEGLVDIKSPSYSARNLQVMSKDAHKSGEATHWHGNMEGKDSLRIIGAKGGWVVVYF